MSEQLGWGDIQMPPEKVTEDDVKKAESMGRAPVGKFIVTCVDSQPREAKMKEYSCYAANLKMEIDEVLELDGAKATESDSAAHEGKFIWDDVLLEHDKEKDGMRKRRILIAKRTGLITNTGAEITQDMWANQIVGKQFIVTTELNSYTDDKGNKKSNVKVAFAGYESMSGAEHREAKDDDFSDI